MLGLYHLGFGNRKLRFLRTRTRSGRRRAENGNNIVLTIDANIQTIAEKYLKSAVEQNNARNGNVIVMNPNTGDILAMAQYPDYNLNTPFSPTSQYWIDKWDSLSSTDKTEMYRNIMVSSRYEPRIYF